MKLTLKLFLVVCLFSSVTFAEGDMPGGGRSCPPNTQCYTGNEQPDPNPEEPNPSDPNHSSSEDSVLTSVQNYLISLFEEAVNLANF